MHWWYWLESRTCHANKNCSSCMPRKTPLISLKEPPACSNTNSSSCAHAYKCDLSFVFSAGSMQAHLVVKNAEEGRANIAKSVHLSHVGVAEYCDHVGSNCGEKKRSIQSKRGPGQALHCDGGNKLQHAPQRASCKRHHKAPRKTPLVQHRTYDEHPEAACQHNNRKSL